MQSILKDLESFGGVEHSYILHQGVLIATTFPELLSEKLIETGRTVSQMFLGAESVAGDFTEMHIELDENLLLCFSLAPELVVVLLARKDVNLALLNVSVRAAGKRIKSHCLLDQEMSEAVNETVAPPMAPAKPQEKVADTGESDPGVRVNKRRTRIKPVTLDEIQAERPAAKNPPEAISSIDIARSEDLSELMDQLQLCFGEHGGELADVTFDDALSDWVRQYKGNKYMLPALLRQLASEISDGPHRHEFLRQAVAFTREHALEAKTP